MYICFTNQATKKGTSSFNITGSCNFISLHPEVHGYSKNRVLMVLIVAKMCLNQNTGTPLHVWKTDDKPTLEHHFSIKAREFTVNHHPECNKLLLRASPRYSRASFRGGGSVLNQTWKKQKWDYGLHHRPPTHHNALYMRDVVFPQNHHTIFTSTLIFPKIWIPFTLSSSVTS